MNGVHLGQIDLNLLRVLEALVREQNVTRAGVRLGLSQSAMSHALARAREVFDDPILVRAHGRMTATERARVLAVAVRTGLASIESALCESTRFDPKTAQRLFTLAMSDYEELVLLPPLLARLREQAPGVDLAVVPAPSSLESVLQALSQGALELAVGPLHAMEHGPGMAHETLFDDEFVCVARRGHPLARGALTLTRFCKASHLLIAPRGQRGGFVDDLLAAQGRARRIALSVPHFMVALHLVAASDLLLTVATRVATGFTEPLGVVTMRSPVELPGFKVSMIWHERSSGDPGLAWLRAQLKEVAQPVAKKRAAR